LGWITLTRLQPNPKKNKNIKKKTTTTTTVVVYIDFLNTCTIFLVLGIFAKFKIK